MKPIDEGQFRRLVADARSGDHDAMRELWRLRRGLVGAVVLAHLPRGVDAEDIVQDVAALFVRRIGSIRDPSSFDPWIRRVAINAAHDAGRERARTGRNTLTFQAALHDPAANTHSNNHSTDHNQARAEDAAEGRRLLCLARELPEQYREPLILRCVRGLSYRAIAHAMELPETTIETRIARARRMLRELADPAQHPDPGRTHAPAQETRR